MTDGSVTVTADVHEAITVVSPAISTRVATGHGAPSGPIDGATVYVDLDTGDVYRWDG